MEDLLGGLLSQNIADIEDLPTFKVPPQGFYKLLISKVDQKKVKLSGDREVPTLSLEFKVLDVMELKKPEEADEISKDDNGQYNQMFNETYFFIPGNDVQKTVQAIKTSYKEVASGLGCTDLNEMVRKMEGLEIYAVLEHRKDRDDKEKVYPRISNAKLATA